MTAFTERAGEPKSGADLMISVVIPTRNRPASLDRTLDALARQDRLPDEVLVVDASDRPLDAEALRAAHAALPITCLHSRPNVCSQRNLGVRRARGSHVLLCDDDVEPPPDYLGRLAAYLRGHPSAGAVTGVVREPDADGRFSSGFPSPSLRRLLYAFVFQLTVWADVEAVEGPRLGALPRAALERWYRRRGNRWSLAGWPLVTQVRSATVDTAIYGLGAALVRRDWLLASPYDERLGTHGIGDNYGVALGFPGERSITILADLPVLHHRAAANRLDRAEAYSRRVLALDYFMRTNARFSRLNTAWLAWSLIGNAALFALRRRGDMLRRTLRVLGVVVTGRNPLLVGPSGSAGERASGRHAR